MNEFPVHSDEKDLLIRLQLNSEEAFTEIYQKYWKKMFYLAAAKLKNLPEAEEVVQDIFLDIWRRRKELQITHTLSSYLCVSVRYRVINLLARKNLRTSYQHLEETQTASTFHSLTHRFEWRDLLEKGAEKLPEKCRLVFQLSRRNGYSHKEIAKHLGISEKTVESHLARAVRKLKLSLQHLVTLALFLQMFPDFL